MINHPAILTTPPVDHFLARKSLDLQPPMLIVVVNRLVKCEAAMLMSLVWADCMVSTENLYEINELALYGEKI